MRSRRRRGDRGAALVEAAIMFPVLVLLILAIVDFGFALRDATLVSRSANAAGRLVSGEGDNRYADFSTLRGVDSTLSGLDNSTLLRVIIYDGDDAGALAACKAAPFADDLVAKGIAGRCSIYGPLQVTEDDPSIGFTTVGTCGATDWDTNFCPVSRNIDTSDPDRVGVFVEVRYDEVTTILPFELVLDHDVVYALEPCVVGDC